MFFKNLFSHQVESAPLMVLYGTKSGNSKTVAEELAKQLHRQNIEHRVSNISKFKPQQLKDVEGALLVVSTHDDGEPPVKARKFYRQLQAADMPGLEQLQFAVCALGDSSYDSFCEAGKTLEKLLKELGAKEMLTRKDCDEEFAQPAVEWIKEVLTRLKKGEELTDEIELESSKWYNGTLKQREVLSVDAENNSTYHLEIDCPEAAGNYKSGDLLDVIPENPADLVLALCEKLETPQLAAAFATEKEITRVNRQLIKAYTEATLNESLAELLTQNEALNTYLKNANVLDLLNDFPAEISGEELLSLLPPIRIRQFSISSVPNAETPIGLMVKTVRFQFNGKKHLGAVSSWLNEISTPGSPIRFRLAANPDFYLPPDRNTPILMIAAGTGVAPFRAFMNEMEQQHFPANAWLLWGEQLHHHENRYYSEFSSISQQHANFLFEAVESRNPQKPMYVQDLLLKKHHEVSAFIEHGAHVYVCGSKAMGEGVEKALQQIFPDSAAWEIFKSSGRYHWSCY
ncbi:sulfite reductase flavoprotein subunit alpha [Draconibacterium sediminis]|uniref:sulfite reductase flavoprotein subunit alpha n=1 Tax=Draconibacterium sediminis TaxID=1544798 RepID=UPI0026ED1738|nr:sulfite reductase flavoprotein subunit alpha [Draconibacterium sediminis]